MGNLRFPRDYPEEIADFPGRIETNVGRSRLEAILGRLKTNLRKYATYLGRLETVLLVDL
jgi:hypothetical protein